MAKTRTSFQCPKCGRECAGKQALANHQRSHKTQNRKAAVLRGQRAARDKDGKLAKQEVSRAMEARDGRVISGRAQLLSLLDRCISYEPNIKLMRDAFNEAIEADALKFFREFVMPLLPKETLVRMFSHQATGIHVVFSNETPRPVSAKVIMENPDEPRGPRDPVSEANLRPAISLVGGAVA